MHRMSIYRLGLALCAMTLLGACGGGGGEQSDPTPLPCDGQCPSGQCFLGTCRTPAQDMGGDALDMEGDEDTGDTTPDMVEPDTVEADMDDPDATPPDMEEPDVVVPDMNEEDMPPDMDEPDVVEAECQEDSDCSSGWICIGEGQERSCAIGCRDDDGCSGRRICEDLTCVEGCRDDSGCARLQICTDQACVEGCRGDDGCARSDYCDTDNEVCVEGCREGGCPSGSLCDLSTRACVEGACHSQEDCPQGSYCNMALPTSLCTQGCDQDSQCGDLRCELSLNRCVCDTDEQCEPGQACQSGSCQTACAQDEDCGPGTYCEPFTQVCVEGCRDDAFEPNNDPTDLFLRSLETLEARLCFDPERPEDQDCYSFRRQTSTRVSLRSDADSAALSLRLYDPQGQVLASGEAVQGGLDLEVEPMGFPTSVCVGGLGDDAQSLDYSLYVAELCDSQARFPTCQEAAQSPRQLTAQDFTPLDGGQLCVGDVEHVAFELEAGDTLELTIDLLSAQRLDLLGPGCQEVVFSLPSFPPGLPSTYQATTAGTYTLRLRNGEATSPWSGLARYTPAPLCMEDHLGQLSLEPNNNEDQASPLAARRGGLYELPSLSLCAGDEDWFAIPVQGGDVLQATVRQDAQAPALAVEIMDPRGIVTLASSQGGDAEHSAQTSFVGSGGDYLVRVWAQEEIPEEGVEYSLSVLTTDQLACAPDGFEGNNTREEAALLTSGRQEATTCEGDIDWYLLPLRSGERVNLSLEYAHGQVPGGQVTTTLYGPDGPEDVRDFFVRDGDSDVDRLSSNPNGLFITSQRAGQWRLQVNAEGVTEALDYTLVVELEEAACTAQDEPVADNDCASARALASSQRYPGQICGPAQDEDWFALQLEQGQTLDVQVEHFHFAGNLEAELYAPDGETLVDFSYNAGPDFERLFVQGTQAGTYCVRVFSPSELTQNNYIIEAYIQ